LREKRTFWTNFDFHVHTWYSFDSAIDPKKAIKVARKKGLKGIAITDHNTIKGGVSTTKQNRQKDLFVITGSEIKIDQYEIIGLFLSREIKSRDFLGVIEEVRAQGGISILAHPFRSKILSSFFERRESLPSYVLEQIDAVEVLNARVNKNRNNMALALATRVKKPMLAGSDAHFYREIGSVQTVFNNISSEEDMINIILKRKMRVSGATFNFFGNLHYHLLSAFYGKVRKLSGVPLSEH